MNADDFYFPRTLGRPSLKQEARDDDRPHFASSHDAWREGIRPSAAEYTREAEELVWRRLFTATPADHGFLLITGEPGSGKSVLLDQWLARWAKDPKAPQLGMSVPILVRLRDLPREAASALEMMDAEQLADRLWQTKPAPRPDLAGHLRAFHAGPTGRRWTPIWLLDGLDELPAALHSERFLRLLGNLPGRVCVSCRTAIAQSLGRGLAGCVVGGQPLELLPFTELEQKRYLELCLADRRLAPELHRKIRGNSQLRDLAGNALLLDLIAEVGREELLPASRSEFYERAIASIWARRVEVPWRHQLRRARDDVLTRLAGDVALDKLIFPVERLDRALTAVSPEHQEPLREALRQSGLLRVDDERERCEFLHLTFQEYYLALHFRSRPFDKVLMERWTKPRYEETLALLLGQTADAKADAALITLIEHGAKLYAEEPVRLWDIGRSPLRTSLHLVSRAGFELARLARLRSALDDQMTIIPLLRVALAVDKRVPSDLLERCARDQDPAVRWGAAENPAMPPEALRELVRDQESDVRRLAARNPATPPEALRELVRDQDPAVRRGAARNPATPPEALRELVRDQESDVRRLAAGNPATPPEALRELVRDQDPTVRRLAAGNPATPPEALRELVRDQDPAVRWGAAGNPAMPPEALRELVRDQDPAVRWGAAGNPAMPPEALRELVRDQDPGVRMGAARNPATPPEALRELVRDQESDVRRGAAENPAMPPEALRELARDQESDVRRGAARNLATPPEALRELARDQDRDVRRGAARNPATPPEALRELARDQESGVRWGAAENPATPPEALRELVRDQESDVRWGAAENPSMLLESLSDVHALLSSTSKASGEKRTSPPTSGYSGACGTMTNEQKPRIFISYSHQDVEWLQRLQVHLRPLVRDGDIDLWDDTRLKAGDKWRQEIKDAIMTPRVAIFLISANFYASDFIATEELPVLLDADVNFGTELIPVLISASRFQRDKILSEFQAINATPLAELDRPMQEKILDQVAQRVEQLLSP